MYKITIQIEINVITKSNKCEFKKIYTLQINKIAVQVVIYILTS